jgi:hypothetical protein
MNFTGFRDFAELYRAAYAETDERKKAHLLREVERIIASTAAELSREASFAAKAA